MNHLECRGIVPRETGVARPCNWHKWNNKLHYTCKEYFWQRACSVKLISFIVLVMTQLGCCWPLKDFTVKKKKKQKKLKNKMSVNRSILYFSTNFATDFRFTFNFFFFSLSIRGCLAARSVLSFLFRDSSFLLSFLSISYPPWMASLPYRNLPTPLIIPPPIAPPPHTTAVGPTTGKNATLKQ